MFRNSSRFSCPTTDPIAQASQKRPWLLTQRPQKPTASLMPHRHLHTKVKAALVTTHSNFICEPLRIDITTHPTVVTLLPFSP